MSKLQITRLDGRSNAQVVIDTVKSGEPGCVYSYDELAAALNEGADRTYGVSEVRTIVVSAQSRLLKEHQRALYNVRGVGYRLAHANDHNRLALIRKDKATTQMRKGVELLENSRWEEMDPAVRDVTQGTLMIVGGLYQQQRAMDRRMNAFEAALQGLREKR